MTNEELFGQIQQDLDTDPALFRQKVQQDPAYRDAFRAMTKLADTVADETTNPIVRGTEKFVTGIGNRAAAMGQEGTRVARSAFNAADATISTILPGGDPGLSDAQNSPSFQRTKALQDAKQAYRPDAGGVAPEPSLLNGNRIRRVLEASGASQDVFQGYEESANVALETAQRQAATPESGGILEDIAGGVGAGTPYLVAALQGQGIAAAAGKVAPAIGATKLLRAINYAKLSIPAGLATGAVAGSDAFARTGGDKSDALVDGALMGTVQVLAPGVGRYVSESVLGPKLAAQFAQKSAEVANNSALVNSIRQTITEAMPGAGKEVIETAVQKAIGDQAISNLANETITNTLGTSLRGAAAALTGVAAENAAFGVLSIKDYIENPNDRQEILKNLLLNEPQEIVEELVEALVTSKGRLPKALKHFGQGMGARYVNAGNGNTSSILSQFPNVSNSLNQVTTAAQEKDPAKLGQAIVGLERSVDEANADQNVENAPEAQLPKDYRDIKLPPQLQGATPRYKNLETAFDSDLDKAIYIVSDGSRSASHDRYLNYLENNFGISEDQAVSLGKRMRTQVKQMAYGKQTGVLNVPSVNQFLNSQVNRSFSILNPDGTKVSVDQDINNVELQPGQRIVSDNVAPGLSSTITPEQIDALVAKREKDTLAKVNAYSDGSFVKPKNPEAVKQLKALLKATSSTVVPVPGTSTTTPSVPTTSTDTTPAVVQDTRPEYVLSTMIGGDVKKVKVRADSADAAKDFLAKRVKLDPNTIIVDLVTDPTTVTETITVPKAKAPKIAKVRLGKSKATTEATVVPVSGTSTVVPTSAPAPVAPTTASTPTTPSTTKPVKLRKAPKQPEGPEPVIQVTTPGKRQPSTQYASELERLGAVDNKGVATSKYAQQEAGVRAELRRIAGIITNLNDDIRSLEVLSQGNQTPNQVVAASTKLDQNRRLLKVFSNQYRKTLAQVREFDAFNERTANKARKDGAIVPSRRVEPAPGSRSREALQNVIPRPARTGLVRLRKEKRVYPLTDPRSPTEQKLDSQAIAKQNAPRLALTNGIPLVQTIPLPATWEVVTPEQVEAGILPEAELAPKVETVAMETTTPTPEKPTVTIEDVAKDTYLIGELDTPEAKDIASEISRAIVAKVKKTPFRDIDTSRDLTFTYENENRTSLVSISFSTYNNDAELHIELSNGYSEMGIVNLLTKDGRPYIQVAAIAEFDDKYKGTTSIKELQDVVNTLFETGYSYASISSKLSEGIDTITEEDIREFWNTFLNKDTQQAALEQSIISNHDALNVFTAVITKIQEQAIVPIVTPTAESIPETLQPDASIEEKIVVAKLEEAKDNLSINVAPEVVNPEVVASETVTTPAQVVTPEPEFTNIQNQLDEAPTNKTVEGNPEVVFTKELDVTQADVANNLYLLGDTEAALAIIKAVSSVNTKELGTKPLGKLEKNVLKIDFSPKKNGGDYGIDIQQVKDIANNVILTGNIYNQGQSVTTNFYLITKDGKPYLKLYDTKPQYGKVPVTPERIQELENYANELFTVNNSIAQGLNAEGGLAYANPKQIAEYFTLDPKQQEDTLNAALSTVSKNPAMSYNDILNVIEGANAKLREIRGAKAPKKKAKVSKKKKVIIGDGPIRAKTIVDLTQTTSATVPVSPVPKIETVTVTTPPVSVEPNVVTALPNAIDVVNLQGSFPLETPAPITAQEVLTFNTEDIANLEPEQVKEAIFAHNVDVISKIRTDYPNVPANAIILQLRDVYTGKYTLNVPATIGADGHFTLVQSLSRNPKNTATTKTNANFVITEVYVNALNQDNKPFFQEDTAGFLVPTLLDKDQLPQVTKTETVKGELSYTQLYAANALNKVLSLFNSTQEMAKKATTLGRDYLFSTTSSGTTVRKDNLTYPQYEKALEKLDASITSFTWYDFGKKQVLTREEIAMLLASTFDATRQKLLLDTLPADATAQNALIKKTIENLNKVLYKKKLYEADEEIQYTDNNYRTVKKPIAEVGTPAYTVTESISSDLTRILEKKPEPVAVVTPVAVTQEASTVVPALGTSPKPKAQPKAKKEKAPTPALNQPASAPEQATGELFTSLGIANGDIVANKLWSKLAKEATKILKKRTTPEQKIAQLQEVFVSDALAAYEKADPKAFANKKKQVAFVKQLSAIVNPVIEEQVFGKKVLYKDYQGRDVLPSTNVSEKTLTEFKEQLSTMAKRLGVPLDIVVANSKEEAARLINQHTLAGWSTTSAVGFIRNEKTNRFIQIVIGSEFSNNVNGKLFSQVAGTALHELAHAYAEAVLPKQYADHFKNAIFNLYKNGNFRELLGTLAARYEDVNFRDAAGTYIWRVGGVATGNVDHELFKSELLADILANEGLNKFFSKSIASNFFNTVKGLVQSVSYNTLKAIGRKVPDSLAYAHARNTYLSFMSGTVQSDRLTNLVKFAPTAYGTKSTFTTGDENFDKAFEAVAREGEIKLNPTPAVTFENTTQTSPTTQPITDTEVEALDNRTLSGLTQESEVTLKEAFLAEGEITVDIDNREGKRGQVTINNKKIYFQDGTVLADVIAYLDSSRTEATPVIILRDPSIAVAYARSVRDMGYAFPVDLLPNFPIALGLEGNETLAARHNYIGNQVSELDPIDMPTYSAGIIAASLHTVHESLLQNNQNLEVSDGVVTGVIQVDGSVTTDDLGTYQFYYDNASDLTGVDVAQTKNLSDYGAQDQSFLTLAKRNPERTTLYSIIDNGFIRKNVLEVQSDGNTQVQFNILRNALSDVVAAIGQDTFEKLSPYLDKRTLSAFNVINNPISLNKELSKYGFTPVEGIILDAMQQNAVEDPRRQPLGHPSYSVQNLPENQRARAETIKYKVLNQIKASINAKKADLNAKVDGGVPEVFTPPRIVIDAKAIIDKLDNAANALLLASENAKNGVVDNFQSHREVILRRLTEEEATILVRGASSALAKLPNPVEAYKNIIRNLVRTDAGITETSYLTSANVTTIVNSYVKQNPGVSPSIVRYALFQLRDQPNTRLGVAYTLFPDARINAAVKDFQYGPGYKDSLTKVKASLADSPLLPYVLDTLKLYNEAYNDSVEAVATYTTNVSALDNLITYEKLAHIDAAIEKTAIYTPLLIDIANIGGKYIDHKGQEQTLTPITNETERKERTNQLFAEALAIQDIISNPEKYNLPAVEMRRLAMLQQEITLGIQAIATPDRKFSKAIQKLNILNNVADRFRKLRLKGGLGEKLAGYVEKFSVNKDRFQNLHKNLTANYKIKLSDLTKHINKDLKTKYSVQTVADLYLIPLIAQGQTFGAKLRTPKDLSPALVAELSEVLKSWDAARKALEVVAKKNAPGYTEEEVVGMKVNRSRIEMGNLTAAKRLNAIYKLYDAKSYNKHVKTPDFWGDYMSILAMDVRNEWYGKYTQDAFRIAKTVDNLADFTTLLQGAIDENGDTDLLAESMVREAFTNSRFQELDNPVTKINFTSGQLRINSSLSKAREGFDLPPAFYGYDTFLLGSADNWSTQIAQVVAFGGETIPFKALVGDENGSVKEKEYFLNKYDYTLARAYEAVGKEADIYKRAIVKGETLEAMAKAGINMDAHDQLGSLRTVSKDFTNMVTKEAQDDITNFKGIVNIFKRLSTQATLGFKSAVLNLTPVFSSLTDYRAYAKIPKATQALFLGMYDHFTVNPSAEAYNELLASNLDAETKVLKHSALLGLSQDNAIRQARIRTIEVLGSDKLGKVNKAVEVSLAWLGVLSPVAILNRASERYVDVAGIEVFEKTVMGGLKHMSDTGLGTLDLAKFRIPDSAVPGPFEKNYRLELLRKACRASGIDLDALVVQIHTDRQAQSDTRSITSYITDDQLSNMLTYMTTEISGRSSVQTRSALERSNGIANAMMALAGWAIDRTYKLADRAFRSPLDMAFNMESLKYVLGGTLRGIGIVGLLGAVANIGVSGTWWLLQELLEDAEGNPSPISAMFGTEGKQYQNPLDAENKLDFFTRILPFAMAPGAFGFASDALNGTISATLSLANVPGANSLTAITGDNPRELSAFIVSKTMDIWNLTKEVSKTMARGATGDLPATIAISDVANQITKFAKASSWQVRSLEGLAALIGLNPSVVFNNGVPSTVAYASLAEGTMSQKRLRSDLKVIAGELSRAGLGIKAPGTSFGDFERGIYAPFTDKLEQSALTGDWATFNTVYAQMRDFNAKQGEPKTESELRQAILRRLDPIQRGTGRRLDEAEVAALYRKLDKGQITNLERQHRIKNMAEAALGADQTAVFKATSGGSKGSAPVSIPASRRSNYRPVLPMIPTVGGTSIRQSGSRGIVPSVPTSGQSVSVSLPTSGITPTVPTASMRPARKAPKAKMGSLLKKKAKKITVTKPKLTLKLRKTKRPRISLRKRKKRK